MAELNVTRKSVGSLLSEMQRRKFIIPEYQRPYKWDREKCEILWNDLTDFYSERNPRENPDQEYYLGTVVICLTDPAKPNGVSSSARRLRVGRCRVKVTMTGPVHAGEPAALWDGLAG